MITEMRLQNFKNFRDATLKLGPLTVIVGTNASGKSNIRDAFRFMHGMSRGYTLAEIFGDKYEGGALQWTGIRGGTREVAYSDNDTFALETRLEISAESATNGRINPNCTCHHRIEVAPVSDLGQPNVTSECFYRGEQRIFDSDLHQDRPAPGKSGKVVARLAEGMATKNYGLDHPFLSAQPVLTQFASNLNYKAKYRRSAEYVVSRLLSMRFVDLSPTAMRSPSQPGQTTLGDRGENLSSVLLAISRDDRKKAALAEWVKELTPMDVQGFDFPPDHTGRVLVCLIESNGQKTSAYSASDGTLRFLAMIAAMLGPSAAPFYFIEEIENGIHPSRLYLLLQLLEQHARQGNVQIVATTHSPQLLAMLSEESREHAALVYRRGGEQEGHITRIMDLPDVRHVLETQNLSRLHESGWLEDAVEFAGVNE